MKRIGRYIVRGLLGRGGMATVFKAALPSLNKMVALKLFDPDPLLVELMGFKPLKSLFVREAVTMANLEHPHIVAVQDFDEDQDKLFYVMRFAANNLGVLMGETYRMEQPSRIIDVDKALRYTRQALDGIACLHDAGIIHRDIKPFNLLLDAMDNIQICDFGLSRLRGETFKGPANLNVGSPYYAAPEQEANPNQAGTRADLYPVGVMLYRMLTGRLPQSTPNQPGYQPPSMLNTNLDAHWDRFIAAAIDPQPVNRFDSAQSMRTALQALETHWEQEKEKTCALPPLSTSRDTTDAQSPPGAFRQTPLKVAPHQGRELFRLDTLWRPRHYVSNRFQRHPEDLAPEDMVPEDIVMDHATNLTWQRSGSAYPRTWHQAHRYIDQLNTRRIGGISRWHLPTAEELVTLLRPVTQGQALCIAPLFDTTQRWLWSADRRSFVAAYYADTQLGFIGWQDFSAPFYVRAVASI